MITFWACALSLTLLLYVLLDGFDLGVGMLFPFAPGETGRSRMLAAISPVWDGNETWLVMTGAGLFGAFPLVYSILLPAFYLPLILMLAGLILRGVAFEFRNKTVRMRPLWDACFVLGSYLAAFVQGAAVGALVHGLPVEDGRFVGGAFSWASPFAILCGAGLCIGYALIGACWLVAKTREDVQDYAYGVLPGLMVALLVFLICAFVASATVHLPVMQRWFERPVLFVFPVLGAGAFIGLALAVARRDSRLPFAMGALIFIAAFLTLAVSFVPYMVPFSVTIEQAAAAPSALSFLFWGAGIVVLPITLLYNFAVYFIFRGKAVAGAEYD